METKTIEFSENDWEWILSGLYNLLGSYSYSESSSYQIRTIIRKLNNNNIRYNKLS